MARWTIRCVVMGHRWTRERLPNRTVRLTCRRCGTIDVVHRDLDFRDVGTFGGGWG